MEYLDHNHGLYVEGNDWCADHRSDDIFDYFNIEYAGVSADNAVNRFHTNQICRFGNLEFTYGTGNYAANRPDYINVLEGTEPILISQDNLIRSSFYDGGGSFRTYSQSVSFVNMGNVGNFDRAAFLMDVIEQLAGYRGTFTGRVLNNMTGMPIEGAEVRLAGGSLGAVTDNNGHFTIERIPTEQITVTVTRRGYTTIDAADFDFEGARELNIDLRMLHPEIMLNPGDVTAEVDTGDYYDMNIALMNRGDGPLEWSSRMRAVPVAGELWQEIQGFDAGSVVEDTRLQAALYLNGIWWIAGGNSSADNPNLLYKLDQDGQLLGSWMQESESNYGWRDLTTDGEFIYGVDAQVIKQIDPATGECTGNDIASDYMPNPTYALTYDPAAEIFWCSGPTSNIIGIDRRGEWVDVINNNNRFRISGLAWYADDPDGYQLYITNADRQRNPEIQKVNYVTEENLFVCSLMNDNDEQPGGGEITSELLPFTVTHIIQMQGREDWLRGFEAGSDFYWVDVDPLEGAVEPGDEMAVNISFDGNGLEVGQTYEAHVQYNHNTPLEEVVWIHISLTVTRPPVNGIEEGQISPFEFAIASVYPNPFNPETTVEFTLDRAVDANLSVFDLSGRNLGTFFSGTHSAGRYQVNLSGHNWASGIYMIQLTDGSRVLRHKVTLVK